MFSRLLPRYNTVSASFFRDANRVPITTDGLITTDQQSLIVANTTGSNTLYTITGSIEVRGLWGQVTTVLSSNITAAYWRINDGSNTPAVTVSTGTTLSSAAVGSVIVKKDVAAKALVLLNASQSRVSEPTTLETTYFSPFVVTALPGATANLEFRYSTTNNPSTGAILFFLRWLPLTSDATVTAL